MGNYGQSNFFINLSKNILSKNGLKSYIIPNTILFNVFAKNYRETLFDKWQINSILDCTNFPIFDGATVRCIITQFENKKSKDKVSYKPTMDVLSFEELIERKTECISKAQLLENNQNWGLVFKLDKSIIDLITKIKKHKKLFEDFDYTQGYIPYRKSDLIKVFGNEKANSIVKNREWHSNEKVNEDYKKEIWGSDFTKFDYSESNSFVFYGKHLATYVDLKYFNQKRLLIREITSPNIIGCIVTEELVNDQQLISVIPKTNLISIEILWSIINSKLATFYHFNSSPKATKGAFPKILVEDIKNFPLPKIDKDNQGKLTNLVDQILTFKKEDAKADTTDLENEIDELVYQLYELTAEEIAIVKAS